MSPRRGRSAGCSRRSAARPRPSARGWIARRLSRRVAPAANSVAQVVHRHGQELAQRFERPSVRRSVVEDAEHPRQREAAALAASAGSARRPARLWCETICVRKNSAVTRSSSRCATCVRGVAVRVGPSAERQLVLARVGSSRAAATRARRSAAARRACRRRGRRATRSRACRARSAYARQNSAVCLHVRNGTTCDRGTSVPRLVTR